MNCGSNSVGRVTAFQAVGRGFESRLPLLDHPADVAQLVEHFLGKEEVTGSIPVISSIIFVICLRIRLIMAKAKNVRQIIILESTAGTGYRYSTTKNKREHPARVEYKKYDPVVRKHVPFKETK